MGHFSAEIRPRPGQLSAEINRARSMVVRNPGLILVTGACAAIGVPFHAFGQTANVGVATSPGTPHHSSGIEDIVVTATRRSERLHTVPIAITALTAAKLVDKQINNAVDLATVVPGMEVKQTSNPLQTTVAIRGVTQLQATVSADPAVGIYTDGVYDVINAGSNTAYIDLDRVEVLKGPQGTLFGRNTIGGAISVTTTKPSDTFGGYVEGDIGNYGAGTATGVINVPVIKGLLDVRLVYQHTGHDGYGHDFTTGDPTNTFDQDYFRGTVKYTPTADLEVLLSGSYDSAQGYSPAARLAYFGSSSFNALIPTLSGHPGDLISNYVNKGGFQDTYADLNSTFALRQSTANVTVTDRLSDLLTIKSITGYIHTGYQQSVDFDGTPYAYTQIQAYPIHSDQTSEELQAYGSALDNRLKYIVGGYFFGVNASQISNVAALFALAPPAARTYSAEGPYVNNHSYSGFGQFTYAITPQLRFTGGVRYVVDDRDVDYLDHKELPGPTPSTFVSCSLANDANPLTGAGGTDPGQCSFSRSAQFSYVPFTAGFDYQPSHDILLYAKVAEGFRSGAFTSDGPQLVAPSATVSVANALKADAAAVAAFSAVAPEKLLSPEIGGKFNLFNNRLQINAAGYYSQYDNVQLTVNLPPPCQTCAPIAVLENSGDIQIFGAEADVVGRIGALELDGSVGYTDPEYTSGPARRQSVINVSKFNTSFGGSYPFYTPLGTLNLNSTYSYRSSATFYTVPGGSLSSAVSDAVRQNGFGLLAARISFDLSRLPVTIAFYGANLTNKHYKVGASDFGAPLSFADYFVGPPLTFGGSIRYNF